MFTAYQPSCWIQQSISVSIRLGFFFFFFWDYICRTEKCYSNFHNSKFLTPLSPVYMKWQCLLCRIRTLWLQSHFLGCHPLCFVSACYSSRMILSGEKLRFLIKAQHCKMVFKGKSFFMSSANCQTAEYIPFLSQYFVRSWGNCLMGNMLYFSLDLAALL